MNSNDNEIIHNVWPLNVGEYHNNEHSLIKKELINYFENYEKKLPQGNKQLADSDYLGNYNLYQSNYDLHLENNDTLKELFKFIAKSIDRVDTDTFVESSPLTTKIFPVIIFSHGFEGWRSQNTTQIQELVSHGYVVFSVDHTHDALITIFEDGTFVKSAKNIARDVILKNSIKFSTLKLILELRILDL